MEKGALGLRVPMGDLPIAPGAIALPMQIRSQETAAIRALPWRGPEDGMTAIETLIAILILTFGLLAAAQMIYVAMGSASLVRSKACAAVAAQDKLDYLADLYRRNSAAPDLAAGDHGPQLAQTMNPADGAILNRFTIRWSVSGVPDPRSGKDLRAKRVALTVTPVDAAGNSNLRVFMNKVVSVTAIFSAADR